jgi:AcrR family transcriptional regulator
MTTEQPNLTPKQELLIAALLSSATIQDAAKAAGVSEATAHRWLRNAAGFDAAYRQSRRAAVGQATARLQQVSGAAVSVLVQVMANKTTPASVRVAAASKVLDFAIKAVELEDLDARLLALEASLGAPL